VFLLFCVNFLHGVLHGLQQKDIGRYTHFQHLNYVLRSATKFIEVSHAMIVTVTRNACSEEVALSAAAD
jgi:hypothetical protein